jgi:3-hydroxyisobutyrate dehydrogenase-like beta-hydroxyacid dehydrogenase
MGITVAASAQNSDHVVYWVSEGRSPQTRERAEKIGLVDAGSLTHLCELCPVIVSVCPPDSAEAVAQAVLAHGFTGLYIDANAISPQRAVRIGHAVSKAGARFVDGGIIGGPAWKPGTTWLHLSGEAADEAAACFSAGPLETSIIGDGVGKASALKMCFAAYTKGSTALLCATLAAAESLGVRVELARQWARDGSDFAEQASQRAKNVTAKAWRFVGEMEEISATFSEAGVPGEFHLAAAEIYRRMAEFKGLAETPSVDEVLSALLERESKTAPA